MPPKKRINPDAEYGYVGDKPKGKAKPKPWVEDERISKYRLDRDRVIYADMFTCQETKESIILKYKV